MLKLRNEFPSPRVSPLLLLSLAACGGDAAGPKATWHAIARESLTEPQFSALDRIIEARNQLATSLFKELSGAVKADGHRGAIAVCQDRAPAIATEVSVKHGVRIGRTSARLRNPSNGTPSWASDWTAQSIDGEANEHIQARGEDELRALFPILVAPPCIACHGQADQLADGVADALAARYPDDQATGFSEGDLRGWFWVETISE